MRAEAGSNLFPRAAASPAGSNGSSPAYIEEHLAEQIPLKTLAQLVRLSPCYFCRAFKQSFGVPPHRYHSARRIEQAKALLARALAFGDAKSD